MSVAKSGTADRNRTGDLQGENLATPTNRVFGGLELPRGIEPRSPDYETGASPCTLQKQVIEKAFEVASLEGVAELSALAQRDSTRPVACARPRTLVSR